MLLPDKHVARVDRLIVAAPYMKRKLDCYLRTYRLRAGLTQEEVAFILGLKTRTFVSYLEGSKREPKLAAAFALYIVFGSDATELFPKLFAQVESSVMARVLDLYERLQGKGSKATPAKLDFLEEVLERAKRRSERSSDGV
jgi:transcriptional regulator with XRE-family HTH domain